MSGSRAKRIRREIYGDDFSPLARRYGELQSGQVIELGRRRLYQARKRGTEGVRFQDGRPNFRRRAASAARRRFVSVRERLNRIAQKAGVRGGREKVMAREMEEQYARLRGALGDLETTDHEEDA